MRTSKCRGIKKIIQGSMAKLFLLRHLKSQWNTEFRFTGWTDVPLDQNELGKAGELAERVFRNQIDKIYSSSLFRNQDTVARMLQYVNKYPIFVHLDPGQMKNWGNYKENGAGVPIYTTEKLNERYYGKLQGINKEEAMKEYGEEKVHLWRRSYNVAPPGGESLKATCNRTTPFYKKYVEADLKSDKNVLVIASHNSLRAIIKYVEKIPDNDIINVEVPYGGLIEYELNESLKVLSKNII